ncbi:shikimate dehydrogenase family protein [Bifidobacterium sp.]|uniref:shikimate dehydrogenase family protein n=1 Tax=Bifidobacterium sp. TaxID=41200 RepID=UPI003D7DFE83
MTNVGHRCAVLGKPIAHSLSPVLHNAAYRALGLDGWFYDKHEVGEPELEGFLESLDDSWAGLSLTMPLKKTIQPYGTPCNTWARELKVANTAVFDWTGTCRNGNTAIPAIRLYNTDVKGIELAFRHSYMERGTQPESERTGGAVIFGNGNTATSALAACTEMPSIGHVTVVARHPDKNAALKPLADKYMGEGSIDIVGMDQAARELDYADVVINTIPGLAADPIAETLASADSLVHGTLLDVVYDPRPTKLMLAWRSHGGTAIGGEEMLLYQAMVQVWLMTGIWDDDPPSHPINQQKVNALEHAMRATLEEAL